MYNYQNLREPRNVSSILADRILVAPLEWFDMVAMPTTTDRISIIEDHLFQYNLGFIELVTKPFSPNLLAKESGEMVLDVTLLGSYVELDNTMTSLTSQPLLILIPDSCTQVYYQLGTFDSPSFLYQSFKVGKNNAYKGYDVRIECTWKNILKYEGDIDMLSEYGSSSMFSEDGITPLYSELGVLLTLE